MSLIQSAIRNPKSAIETMGLIKSQNAPADLRPFSMKDIEEAARRMLLRAKHQAEQLLAAAQREADVLKLAAQAEGRREGIEQGTADGTKQGQEAGRAEALQQHAQQLTEIFQTLSNAASEFDAHRQDFQSEALREVVQL